MKRKIIIVGVALLIIISLFFVSCSSKDEEVSLQVLETPQNVRVVDRIIQWDEVAGAIGYIVCIDDEKYPATTNMYDFSASGLGKGKYIISVIAVGDKEKYTDSATSAATLFDNPGQTYTLQVISENGGTTSISKKSYSENDVVDLVAYPKEKYHFDGWFSDDYFKLSPNTNFSFKINADTVLYAQFSPDPELIDKSDASESNLMQCSENFAVVVYCPEEDAAEYIKDNFFIYDDYFLDNKGNVVIGYEEYAERRIGRIDPRGNGLYLITPSEKYQNSGSYVAKATGNVSILKEYSRIVNSNNSLAAAEAENNVDAFENEGLEEMVFSIENTPHIKMCLQDDVLVYSFTNNKNANSSNIDGWVTEKIGTGLSDDETGAIGGFITQSIGSIEVGRVIGFGGGITRDISLDQITENTVFGRVRSITYCGGEEVYYPIIFVELEPVDSDNDVFYELDVYQEGEVDIGEYIEENEEELTIQAMAMFNQSDDYHRFLATVSAAAESYSQENGLTLLGLTNTSSFLDKIKITPKIDRKGKSVIFSVKGSLELEFGKKNTKAVKASGKFTISFEFTETLTFEYNFSWVKKNVKILGIKFKITNGIDLRLVTTQDTHFVFDAAVVYTANTQTGYMTNERSKWIHKKDCQYVTIMSEGNRENTTDTLEELEKKGYTPCKVCLRSKYVLNTSTKCIHRTGCWHTKQMLETNKKPSNRELSELVNDGYWPCGTCLPNEKSQWQDYEATENFRKKISESLSYSDWGDKLKEIKENYQNADSLGDSSKDFKLIDIPFNCIVTIRLQIYLTLSFKVEASIHYEQRTTNRFNLGIRATLSEGFRASYSKEEIGETKEFTLLGKVELKAGVKLEVTVMDPLGIVQVGIYGSCGIYADLAGVLHLSSEGENYAAAYFEMGFYYDFGITYKVCYVVKGSVSLSKLFGLSGKVPFLKLGYNKVVYAYENDIQEVLVQASEAKTSFTLQELGLMNVKNYTLPAMKTGTEVLDASSSAFNVKLKLASGKYFEIDGVKIKVKDNAPFGETFEDELTIAITSKDTSFKLFKGDNYILYLPTIKVKLVGANKCEEHVMIYLEKIEPDCVSDGYEECLMCTRCQKLFNVDQTKELSERKTIAALEHIGLVLERVEPTCTAIGITEGLVCTRCGEVLVQQETIDALGHIKSDAWETIRLPKCDSQGTQCNHCARCDIIVDYRPILPTGHTRSTYAPQCEEAVVCTSCAKVLIEPKGHRYTIVDEKDAPCTEEEGWGYIEYQCTSCNAGYVDMIEPTGHTTFEMAKANDAPIIVSKSASCTEEGAYTYYCAKCDKALIEPIAALGHLVALNWTTDIPGGCETAGEESHHCLRPGCTYRTDVRPIPAKGGHVWSDWIVDNLETCDEAGSLYRICTSCSERDVKAIPAKGHKWSLVLVEEPNCTCQGVSYNECVNCSKREYCYVAELGHDASELTCTNDSVCGRCGEVLQKAQGHNYEETEYTAATFDKDGSRLSVCSHCGDSKKEIIPMLKHDWVEVQREEASCSTAGYILYECNCSGGTCNETKIETLEKLPHTLVHRDAVAADCSKEGRLECEECVKCGAYIKNGREVTAAEVVILRNNDHSFVEYSAKAPTCTESGWSSYRECSRCHRKLNYQVLPASHTIVDDAAVAVTCTTDGKTAGSHCSVCGDVCVEQEVIPAPGHDYLSTVTEPTCLDGGYTTHTCTRCGDSYVDSHVDPLGHDWGDIQPAKDPTCTESGWKEYQTCSRCGNSTLEVIEPTGHTYKHFDKRPAGCLTEGHEEYYECSDCKSYFNEKYVEIDKPVVIPAEGHNMIHSETHPATCYGEGYTLYTCSRSDYSEKRDKKDIIEHNYAGNHGKCLNDGCGCTQLIYEYDESKNGLYVTGYNGSLTEIKMPLYDLWDGKMRKVIGIKENAFANNTKITSIEISESVQTIDEKAFLGCTALKMVTIPNSVTLIGGDVFKGCSSLESLTIPFVGQRRRSGGDSYQYPLGYLFGTEEYTNSTPAAGSFFLKSSSSTTEMTYYIPSSLRSVTVTDGGYLPRGAFYSCTMITSITLKNVTWIGESAFNTRKTWTKLELVLDNCSLTNIDSWAFEDCNGLLIKVNDAEASSEFIVPAGCTLGPNNPFSGKSGITSITVEEAENQKYKLENGYLIEIATDVLINASKGSKGYDIPIGVTAIAGGAFRTRSITSITIPAGVTSIGSYAFDACKSLATISFEEGSKLKSIGSYAFRECSKLTSISIPAGVKKIPSHVFEACSSLASFTMATDVESIGSYAFKNTGLTSFTLPEGLTSISDGILEGTLLTSIIIPSSVKTIGNYAFKNCLNLTEVTIPKGVTSIGKEAFRANNANQEHPSQLKKVIFENGSELTSLGKCAFQYCSALTSLSIPKTVTTIGEYAFDACYGLTSIIVEKGNPVYHSDGNCLIVSATKTLLRGCQTSVIPTDGSVTSIADSAFWRCETLTHIVIPEGVTTIGPSAFEFCYELTYVVLPASLRSIAMKCFHDAWKLGEIYYYGSQADWGNVSTDTEWKANAGKKTANGAYRLLFVSQGLSYTSKGNYYTVSDKGSFKGTSLVIPPIYNGKPVAAIAPHAFDGCDNLTSVWLPEGITTIGSYAFNGCECVSALVIPASVTTIEEKAFSEWKSATSLTFAAGSKLKSIGHQSFSGWLELKSVVVPSTVENIGTYAFYACRKLESITIPFIGDRSGISASSTNQYPLGYLFGSYIAGDSNATTSQTYYSTSSTSTTTTKYYIPTTLKKVVVTGGYVPYHAFQNCTMLTTVELLENVTGISVDAFEKCSNLASVTLPFVGTTKSNNKQKNLEGWFGSVFNTTNPNNGNLYEEMWSTDKKNISESADRWSCWIPKSLKTVRILGGSYLSNAAFIKCRWVETFDLSGMTITQLPYDAFWECDRVTTIILPSTVQTIGEEPFGKCIALASITIPSSVTTIGVKAFINCTKLNNVSFAGNNVTLIDESAFEGCTALKSITIPASVTTLGLKAFKSCTALESVDFAIGSNLSYIDGAAFKECTSLKTIKLPDKVECIGGSAFYHCTSLKGITIPKSVTEICSDAFANSGLTSVSFESGSELLTIGERAFYACPITGFKITAKVNMIGAQAFYNTSLNKVEFEKTSGWKVASSADASSWSSISVTDTTKNASNLKKNGSNGEAEKYWKRS